MSRLQQINLRYDAPEDRLLLRISTSAQLEHRLWLTRTLVKLWWPGLTQSLRAETERSAPAAAASAPAREAVQAFRHEAALQNARFGEPYQAESMRPAQPVPILVHSIQGSTLANGEQQFVLLPAQGEGVTLRLSAELLHAFVKLLRDAVAKTQWDLLLPAPFAAVVAAQPEKTRLN